GSRSTGTSRRFRASQRPATRTSSTTSRRRCSRRSATRRSCGASTSSSPRERSSPPPPRRTSGWRGRRRSAACARGASPSAPRAADDPRRGGLPMARPFRFGVQLASLPAGDFASRLRRIEALGYSTVFWPDHFHPMWDPVAALAAAAVVTTKLRIGSLVYGGDYRHPVVLPTAAAPLQLL